MNNKLWFLTTLLILFTTISQAQKKIQKVNYEKEPAWIKMMDDPNVNFYETVKAFREYYKERALPKEPFEVEGEDDFEKQVGLEEANGNKKSKSELKREARKIKPNEVNYAGEVRAFRSWFYSIQPWVRADGSIVSPEEQRAIVEKQHAELKEIEKVNGKN